MFEEKEVVWTIMSVISVYEPLLVGPAGTKVGRVCLQAPLVKSHNLL